MRVFVAGATDGTAQLRYLAGADAEQTYQARQQLGAVVFNDML